MSLFYSSVLTMSVLVQCLVRVPLLDHSEPLMMQTQGTCVSLHAASSLFSIMAVSSMSGRIVAAVVFSVVDANGAIVPGSHSNDLGEGAMNGGNADLLQSWRMWLDAFSAPRLNSVWKEWKVLCARCTKHCLRILQVASASTVHTTCCIDCSCSGAAGSLMA